MGWENDEYIRRGDTGERAWAAGESAVAKFNAVPHYESAEQYRQGLKQAFDNAYEHVSSADPYEVIYECDQWR
jgi:hypothetical protein